MVLEHSQNRNLIPTQRHPRPCARWACTQLQDDGQLSGVCRPGPLGSPCLQEPSQASSWSQRGCDSPGAAQPPREEACKRPRAEPGSSGWDPAAAPAGILSCPSVPAVWLVHNLTWHQLQNRGSMGPVCGHLWSQPPGAPGSQWGLRGTPRAPLKESQPGPSGRCQLVAGQGIHLL